MQAAKAGQIDLVILDVGLPDIDGREAVRILRKNGFKAPIIMLAGHGTICNTILGLEFGRQRLHHQAVSLRRPCWRTFAPSWICSARASGLFKRGLQFGMVGDLAADVADEAAEPRAQQAQLPMVTLELLGMSIARSHHRRVRDAIDE